MKKWIRWKGLIAFAAAAVLLILVWVLVVDAVVRRTIETVGTRAVGARVDLAKADLSLFPAGLELTGLAVTNPDSPMQNAVEIGHMKMDLDPGYLIKRKVIINDMVVEGLKFNTARQRSGEVPELARKREEKKKIDVAGASKAAAEKVCGKFTMPSLSRPDIKAILAKEPLDSIALATNLDKKLKAEQARWEKELGRLADEKTLNEYRARVEKIKGAGGSLGAILGAAGEVQQLQADIQKDLNLLKQAQTTFTKDFTAYQQQVRDLANAPLKDINRLMEKYSLSPTGLANLSQLIFGEKLCGWVQTASDWYRKVEPYIGQVSGGAGGAPEEQEPLRGKGKNIRFAETPPMPDFLIRNLKVNAQVAAGNLTGKAGNITLDQHILGTPMTFAFLGKEMKQIASLSLIGTANYVKPDDPRNNARLAIKGLALENLPLVREASFPMTLKQATSDLNLKLETAGNVLDAVLKANFRAVQLVSGASEQQTAITEAIHSAISRVDRFSLNADIAGTLEAYTVDITSDLDKVLKSAVGNLVKKEAAKFQ
ncbi:MAG: TIGR03545 family protein, partial [Desulfosarcina sp.]|nr:TIGR03545 family protein [Desulfosarcina sp.]